MQSMGSQMQHDQGGNDEDNYNVYGQRLSLIWMKLF